MTLAQTFLSTSSPVPLYHQIWMLLRSRITEGEYPVGTALPTEEELQAEFNVSRATIRQAIGELVRSGLVARRRGSGTWVLPGAGQLASRRFKGSLTDLMAEKRAQISEIEIKRDVEVPAWVAGRLQLRTGVATLVRRLWALEDQPLAYKLNYLPTPYGRTITKRKLTTEPHLMRLIESEGVIIARAIQSIRARAADHEVAQRLKITVGDPVLFVERLVFEAGGQPVELAQTWYRGDTYEYTVMFDLTRGQGAEADLA